MEGSRPFPTEHQMGMSPNITLKQMCQGCFSLRLHFPGKPFISLCIYDVETIFLFLKQDFKMLFPKGEGHFSILHNVGIANNIYEALCRL